jgi:hypothetical protein
VIIVIAAVVLTIIGTIAAAIVGVGIIYYPVALQILVLVVGLTYLGIREIITISFRRKTTREHNPLREKK